MKIEAIQMNSSKISTFPARFLNISLLQSDRLLPVFSIGLPGRLHTGTFKWINSLTYILGCSRNQSAYFCEGYWNVVSWWFFFLTR